MAVNSADLQPRILNRELSQLDFNGRVLELNGAVDFRPLYASPGRDVYADALSALAGSMETVALDSAAADAG